MDVARVKEMALAEFETEEIRKAIDREKERLRRRANFWVRIFPWRIVLERRELPFPTKEDRIRHHVSSLRKLGVMLSYKYGDVVIQQVRGVL